MKRINRQDFQGDLTSLFIPGDPVALMPSSVGDELLLVHPYLSGHHNLRSVQFKAASGAAGATDITIAAVPSDRIWYVQSAAARISDATSRLGFIYVQLAVGGVVALRTTGTLVNGLGQRLCVDRSFLLGPGQLLGARVDAIGAAAVLTIEAAIVEQLLSEPIPPL